LRALLKEQATARILAVSVATDIETKLKATLNPLCLEIVDESARHAGHAGMQGHAREGGETHFRLLIVSRSFEGQSRVARQRMVYAALSQELANGVHAIAMTTLTPAEADQRPS
jgi:BolA family transcriptional regulator, general stress-responsive regulator